MFSKNHCRSSLWSRAEMLLKMTSLTARMKLFGSTLIACSWEAFLYMTGHAGCRLLFVKAKACSTFRAGGQGRHAKLGSCLLLASQV